MSAALDPLAPATLDEALAALAHSPALCVVAGGTSKNWVQPTARVVSLHALKPELRFLALRPDGVKLGALTTWRDVAQAGALHEQLPLLAAAARHVGPLAIQSRATIGGHLVRPSTSGDARAMWLALDAQVELRSRSGLRWVSARDLWSVPAQARRPDELIVAVRAPLPPSEARQLFARRASPDGSHAPVVLAGVVDVSGRTVRHVRLALGGATPLPVRLLQTEELLLGKRLTPGLVDKAVAAGRGEIHPVLARGQALPAPVAAAVSLLAESLRSL